jgi:phage-related protein
MAITDMADNANKMGTSMESIQNAYQGFAKQNYTMLDNLKLGYGGTKEEMKRLLEDAEKLSGIHYDISNLNDVYSAIHVIQEELDITGTTAKEASTTIQGSAAAMKAAWQNMLVGIADENADFDTLINNLVESVSTFGENILPRIEIALKGVGKLISGLAPVIVEALPNLLNTILPEFINAVMSIVDSIIAVLPELLPTLIDAAVDILM